MIHVMRTSRRVNAQLAVPFPRSKSPRSHALGRGGGDEAPVELNESGQEWATEIGERQIGEVYLRQVVLRNTLQLLQTIRLWQRQGRLKNLSNGETSWLLELSRDYARDRGRIESAALAGTNIDLAEHRRRLVAFDQDARDRIEAVLQPRFENAEASALAHLIMSHGRMRY
jgi:hypothetical protein